MGTYARGNYSLSLPDNRCRYLNRNGFKHTINDNYSPLYGIKRYLLKRMFLRGSNGSFIQNDAHSFTQKDRVISSNFRNTIEVAKDFSVYASNAKSVDVKKRFILCCWPIQMRSECIKFEIRVSV